MTNESKRLLQPIVLASVALMLATIGCWRSDSGSADALKKAGHITLIVSCDTAGWIVPCGCTSNQSGGLLRRHSLVEKVAAENRLVVDVGGATQGTSTYDRLKFEAILQGELAMGLTVHNLGAGEIKLGLQLLRQLPAKMREVLISANTRDRRQQPIAPPSKLTTMNGQRLAFLGIIGCEFSTDEVEVMPPRQAVLDALANIRGQYDRAILLAYVNERELDELARLLPEVDLIVGGPTGQSVQPHRAGAVMTAAITNKGKFVATFDVPPAGSQDWRGSILEVSDLYVDHPLQKANLSAFYATLAERQLAPSETSFVESLPPNVPADFRISGSQSCLECHHNDCRDRTHNNAAAQDWTKTNHADAWNTLQSNGSHVDAYCQQCHTTGYGLPGGFETLAATPQLVSVGCESCHGPSAAHAKMPKQRSTAYHGQAKSHCVKCHDRENSPEFQYDRYWAALISQSSQSPNAGAESSAKEGMQVPQCEICNN